MSLKMWWLKATLISDRGFMNVQSLCQNTCYQGYSLQNFVHIHLMHNQKEKGYYCMDFAHDIRALAEIVTAHTSLLLGKDSKFTKTAHFLLIKQSFCDPLTQQEN